MAVKDVKPPKAKAKAKAQTQADYTDSAWRYEDDGRRVRNSKALPLENKLKEFIGGISGAIALAGDNFSATVIGNKAPDLAYGYAKLASENPNVKKVLTFLLEGSAYTEALLPSLTVGLAIGWHYGFFVPDKLGVPMVLASGAMPITREQEVQMRQQHKAEQDAAAAAEAKKAEDENRSSN